MSYWSTLKSIFRTPKPPATRLTISIAFPDGSGAFDYPVSLPPFVEDMLLKGNLPQHVAIWKHSELPFATGPENMVRLQLCHLLCFPLSQSHAQDGLAVQRLTRSGWLQ